MTTLIRRNKAPGLMLTPLLDMFTIILIFLIVSFDAEDYDYYDDLWANDWPEQEDEDLIRPASIPTRRTSCAPAA